MSGHGYLEYGARNRWCVSVCVCAHVCVCVSVLGEADLNSKGSSRKDR